MSDSRKFRLVPGSMGVVSLAINLFGISNVDPGSWASPVYLTCELSDPDIRAGQDLIDEYVARFPEAERLNVKIERI